MLLPRNKPTNTTAPAHEIMATRGVTQPSAVLAIRSFFGSARSKSVESSVATRALNKRHALPIGLEQIMKSVWVVFLQPANEAPVRSHAKNLFPTKV